MTAIRSTEITRTEDMTAKPAFRGCRAIVVAAAAITYGLLAAPLHADHETFDVTVTLVVTVGDGQVELQTSYPADSGVLIPPEVVWIGYHYQWKRADAQWDDDWWNMIEDRATVSELENGTAYSFRSRAFRMHYDSGGGQHYAYSEPSEAVTGTPTVSTE